MHPRSRKLLCDALLATDDTLGFVVGKSFTSYESDLLLRSAVERQLTIIGEALVQFASRESNADALIPSLFQIRGFRNRLIHDYGKLEDAIVWSVVIAKLPELRATLQRLLEQE